MTATHPPIYLNKTVDNKYIRCNKGAVRKADRVADDLLRRIVGGDLDVGSLLPKEVELAQSYGVNRSVVREAIKLLEVHRLVRPIRRRGTEVLNPMASVSPDVLRAMLRGADGRLDVALLRDFLEVRAQLDEQMCVLAATNRGDEDLAALDRIIERLEAVVDASSAEARVEFYDLCDELARGMASASKNRIFQMLVWWNQQVAEELREVFRTSRPGNRPHLDGMRLLVEMVRAGQPEQVRTLIRAFHDWASPRLVAAAALNNGESASMVMERMREEVG